jgi:hypothetical protein
MRSIGSVGGPEAERCAAIGRIRRTNEDRSQKTRDFTIELIFDCIGDARLRRAGELVNACAIGAKQFA